MKAGEVKREVERQLDVMREGSVEFYGENALRQKLAECLAAGRLAASGV